MSNYEPKTLAGEGFAAGAILGAVSGALVGLGILSGSIPALLIFPGLGAIEIILMNAIGGVIICGLIGSLIGLGVPEDDYQAYEKPKPKIISIAPQKIKKLTEWDDHRGLIIEIEGKPSSIVFTKEFHSEISLDGDPATQEEVVDKFKGGCCVCVVLHPQTELYGASLQAEFTTC